MSKSFESNENNPVSDEQMIEILRLKCLNHPGENPLEDPETKLLYDIWYAAGQIEADRAGTDVARIAVGVRRAVIYYMTGYSHLAIPDLEETLEGIASLPERNADRDELEQKVVEFLRKMRAGEAII